MLLTTRSLLIVVVVVTVAAAGSGIAGTVAAPQFQPLQSVQFAAAADGRSYAPAYAHAVRGASPAAVQVGYAPSVVYKPDLSAYAAASFAPVDQLRRFDPVVRPVQTVVPRVTAVEPSSVGVLKTYVDVPVAAAYPYEYRLQDPSPYYYRYDYNNQLLVDRK